MPLGDRFEARISPAKSVGAVASVIVVLLGLLYASTWTPSLEVKAASWVAVVLVGVMLVVGLPLIVRRLFNQQPQVTIDAQGIHSCKWPFGMVPWSDVERLSVFRPTHASHFFMRAITIKLRDPAPYLSRLGQRELAARDYVQRSAPGTELGDLTVGFNSLSPGLPEALVFITDRLGIAVDRGR